MTLKHDPSMAPYYLTVKARGMGTNTTAIMETTSVHSTVSRYCTVNCTALYINCTQDRLTESYSTFAYTNQPARVAPAGEVATLYTLYCRGTVLCCRPGGATLTAPPCLPGTGPTPAGRAPTSPPAPSWSGPPCPSCQADCVLQETIWGVSSVGNSYQPVGGAPALQAAAHAAVVGGAWEWPEAGPAPCPTCLG